MNQLQFKQRGIFYFPFGFIVLKKIKHVTHYLIYVWTDKGYNLSLIHQAKYNGEEPKVLLERFK